jgi:deoxyribodipyrimidine photolyase-related protein
MTSKRTRRSVRNLVLVLGDQLDRKSSALEGFHLQQDLVWMAELAEDAEQVRSHKARIAFSLSTMRHFRDDLRERGVTVHYRALDDPDHRGKLADELDLAVDQFRPERIVVVQPGQWRSEELLRTICDRLGVALEVREDQHFLCSRDEFSRFARQRRSLPMEQFYRHMRRKTEALMEGKTPVGGKWTVAGDKRLRLPRKGTADIPRPMAFKPDTLTREVLELVGRRFAAHPGSLEHFDWPVTARQAREALVDFVRHRLPWFVAHQETMHSSHPFLYHSRLAAAMNVKLLDPRDGIAAAEAAYHSQRASLSSVESFIRQILGWREYVRGIYWHLMPEYRSRNELAADRSLPAFYWTGETEMHCLRETIAQVLTHGYSHHIQRLMVTGQFALLLGVAPLEVLQWFLAVHVDAAEWAAVPNVLGLSQFADGGLVAAKPCAAGGAFIHRASGCCRRCRFNPDVKSGQDACPFNILYWDFLQRHQSTYSSVVAMKKQLARLNDMPAHEMREIVEQADRLRNSIP